MNSIAQRENSLVAGEVKADIKALRKKLTPRERSFCELYVYKHLHNATRAYIEMVTVCKKREVSQGVASTQGWRMLQKSDVKAYIAALDEQITGKIEISGMEMVDRFQAIADDKTAAHTDRLRALENIAKIAGVYAENVNNDTKILIVNAHADNLAK